MTSVFFNPGIYPVHVIILAAGFAFPALMTSIALPDRQIVEKDMIHRSAALPCPFQDFRNQDMSVSKAPWTPDHAKNIRHYFLPCPLFYRIQTRV
jgi:hypothetical protein